MTNNFKVGTYVKREDYNKAIIQGIVFGSIFIGIFLTATIISFTLVVNVAEDYINSINILLELGNKTNPDYNGTKIEDSAESFKTPILFIGMSIIPFMILGAIIGYWVADQVYQKLGLHKWNVHTCRCCGKLVGEHEEHED